MKTSELTGIALDWAVAKCENLDYETAGGSYMEDDENHEFYGCSFCTPYSPSTNWAQGGPIIEREKISVWSNNSVHYPNEHSTWQAEKKHFSKNHNAGRNLGEGSTPLEAAMRCYVASKLGNEVEIPKEIQK